MADYDMQDLTVKSVLGSKFPATGKSKEQCQVVFLQFDVYNFSAQHLCVLAIL